MRTSFFFDSRRYLAQSTVSFFVWLCSELSDARWCICKKTISSPPLSALTLIALLRLSGFFPLLPTGSNLLSLMRQVGVLLKRPCVPLRERGIPRFPLSAFWDLRLIYVSILLRMGNAMIVYLVVE